ncbi:MAG: radical SAM protein [bacterium]|nr:radical SAM protein [bacterium]
MKIEEIFREKCIERRIPMHVMLEITYRCNLRCIHCYVGKVENELSLEEIKRILSELYSANVLFLTFTGGEIFVREDFLEILKYATEKRFCIFLKTNGTLITEEIVKVIKDSNVEKVEVSLYGATSTVHNNIVRKSNSFEKTINGIKLLRKARINVRINTVVLSKNISEIKDIKELATTLGTSVNFDIYISPKTDGSISPLKYRLGDKKMCTFLKQEFPTQQIVPIEEAEKIEENSRNVFCSAITGEVCIISPTGKVYPCVNMDLELGDIRKTKFMEIFKNSKELNKLRNLNPALSPCMKCDLYSYCSVCPAQSLLEEGDILKCHSEAKRIAQLQRKIEKSFQQDS